MHDVHFYSAYGLTVRSGLALPELRPADAATSTVDVEVRCEALPPPPPFPDGEARYRYVEPRATETYFAWKGLGAFLVREGREIVVDPHPDAPADELRLPLLGVVLGILLHQRGRFTLHASAVAVDGGAIAFIGQKGAGKSTTAAALLKRGHALLTDDVLALDVGESGDIMAYPAFPQIKLWPASAQGLGYTWSALARLSDDLDKRAVRSLDAFSRHPLPLRRIYHLADGSTLNAERLRGGRAFAALLSQSYAPRFLGSRASTPAFFDSLQALVRRVPAYRLQRPHDLAQLDDVAAYVAAPPSRGASPAPA